MESVIEFKAEQIESSSEWEKMAAKTKKNRTSPIWQYFDIFLNKFALAEGVIFQVGGCKSVYIHKDGTTGFPSFLYTIC